MTYFKRKVPKFPRGKIGFIAHESFKDTGAKVDNYIVEKRKEYFSDKSSNNMYLDNYEESYLIEINNIRFSNGEGKAVLEETVSGRDIFIIADVGNYSCTYKMFGMENHMSPDEHFQDIKRTISAIAGKAKRITVIMPLLYAGRQDRRKGRESLDCAMALQELERLGVSSIVTFDAHEPKVQNAVPQINFDSLHSTYGLLKSFIEEINDIKIDSEHMLVVSPDSGAMDRAIYFANVLGLDAGMFYKRRDYSKVIDGKNPIVQHEYLGADVSNRDILIVDDMIASGGSVFDLMDELSERKSNNLYVAVTFAFFTEGLSKFDEYYEKGLFKKVFSTNLTYVPDELKKREWFIEVDMSKHIAHLIHKLNYEESTSKLFDATKKIQQLLQKEKLI
ncbi:MAG: ribose-phosphate pyrophosphokinase [Desulfobacterales bacterium]|nr:ribose-phosphate pyrophosphokinase [Desulfobacterales bacterium]